MKTRQLLPVVFGFGLLTMLAFGQHTSTAPEKGWQKDFAKATAQAKKTGKLVMVDFNATWCGPCKLYKKDVFPTAGFKSATKDVILVDIDIDEHPELASKFHVTSIPDVRFFSPSGKQVGAIMGYGGPDALLNELAKAKKAAK